MSAIIEQGAPGMKDPHEPAFSPVREKIQLRTDVSFSLSLKICLVVITYGETIQWVGYSSFQKWPNVRRGPSSISRAQLAYIIKKFVKEYVEQLVSIIRTLPWMMQSQLTYNLSFRVTISSL